MRVEAFCETCSDGEGFIRRMDTRAKLVFSTACILFAVASANPAAPVAVGAVCLGLLVLSGASVRAILFRMSEPLVFALMLGLFQAFLTRGEPLMSFGLFGATVSVSVQGVHKGALIMSRVFGAVAAALFLTMTTRAYRLLSAAARLKAPRALVELSLFAYRYIFVLLEDALTVYQAQKGRLGYCGLMRGIRSLGTLAGSVFLRAFNQAEASGASMALRGYTGEYLPSFRESFRAHDAVILGALFALCVAVGIWTP